MTDKIWILKMFHPHYDSDFNQAAFLTEKAANDYLKNLKVNLEEIISIWKDCRQFDYYPSDYIEYTESEQKFFDMTNHNPWDFLYEEQIRYHFEGYSIEEVPLYG